MAAPTKELEKMVIAQELVHGGNPVLTWMVSNTVVRTDPAGNIKPDKEKSTERIDGVVALVMALDRATRNGNTASVYESRGVLTFGTGG
jgi:phage terminase large subunit-like protein